VVVCSCCDGIPSLSPVPPLEPKPRLVAPHLPGLSSFWHLLWLGFARTLWQLRCAQVRAYQAMGRKVWWC
jgi:hypothetical protein